MRHQAIRAAALMLGVLLVGAAPARAATITFEDVVRAVGASGQVRPADEVRLRFASQSGRAAGQQDPPAQGTESPATQQQPSGDPAAGGAPTATSGAADATLSQTGGGGQVETVDLGDVTGTVCDCGEIPPIPGARRGFPWWLLGGIPLICVSGICFDGDNGCIVNCGPNGTPTPTPPPPQIPEPTTLLLFGSGLLALGARARRRFGRKGLDTGTDAPAEEV
ncbi:MAG TPA: PEP-CTERM sorting domain-containing protein [Pyrinomonadaceae bacterium]|nr:PEP-CTERM sorting domain-containing protein [Pyrinomonadaceae bacterium]